MHRPQPVLSVIFFFLLSPLILMIKVCPTAETQHCHARKEGFESKRLPSTRSITKRARKDVTASWPACAANARTGPFPSGTLDASEQGR